VEVIRSSDPQAFLDLAHPLLARDPDAEARHNLMLGIAGSAAAQPGLYRAFHGWVATRELEPLAAASRTPPFNAIVADPTTPEAMDAVVDAVLEDDPATPGLVGNLPHVHRAAERWAGRTGAGTETTQRQGVYALTRVREVPAPEGGARPATADDRDLLLGWLLAFSDEAVASPPDEPGLMERMLDARLVPGDAGYWLWEDGGAPVSLAGYAGPTPGGIRVGPVYTPPARRRHGYATRLVADLSRWLLEGGHRACYLYTDLANPTSNAIYARIGYQRVCDSAEIRFLPAPGRDPARA
jgi:predicted GNAT family acetyltransferase